MLLGRGGWPFALSIAIGVHVAIGAIGAIYYTATRVLSGPQILLPYGWSADFEGNGDRGTVSYSPSPSPIPSLGEVDASATTATISKDLLIPPPGDFEIAPVQVHPSALQASAGTSDESPLIGLAMDSSAPLVNFNPSPFAGTGNAEGTQSSAGAPVQGTSEGSPQGHGTGEGNAGGVSHAHGGTANSGSGSGDGGGKIGVPTGSISSRGMPIRYPDAARERGLTGTVTILFDVTPSGAVANVRIASSSGEAILDRAAKQGVERWSPPQGLWGGVNLRVPVTFADRLNQ